MDKLVGGVREVVIDDVLHLRNVQPSGGDGGSYENLEPALSEVCESLLPLPLCSVPVDAGGQKILSGQVGGQVVCAGLFLQEQIK